ncbi:hypothetical protein [Spirosoma sp.]|uniref:hypothetical protein n=1 Tax=Spirosoma sp. TaxID=1899569 RepID=UPI0026191AF8|nr:hypothetical protein [Spirosoma sp.]MCX6214598.1 hypothetical protein [Spirosoma sp.]
MMPLDQNPTLLVLSGIHCKTYEPVDVKPPNWALLQSFIDASGGRIRLVMLSPEWTGSADLSGSVLNTACWWPFGRQR